ncbi:hypothetical protein GLYMA_04G106600v4 [Glycine max]|uniref:Uncharacterized protein n=1 Tax=Glycine max TaxID=3847 RepID=K7KJC8_SOYBN|nr:hypothetical protein JHK87_009545 [Glycine soja]KAH1110827.1 hypothetical protein GYH30_009579 [Glycine max]KRH62411.1 hypothetical protein GLYMA_04G106600v4 [Glycine max]
MDSIACFAVRSWSITEFWGDEIERVEAECQKGQVNCAKAEQALVEADCANKTLLRSTEESQESLAHVETKLKEFET